MSFPTWTIAQRRGLLAILTIALVLLAIEWRLRPAYIGDTPSAIGSRSNALADRIDPNTATAAELSSIPQLGPAKAAAIVAYREKFAAAHAGGRAFENVYDLTNVKGIGRATAEKWKANMSFESPATQRSGEDD